MPNRKQIFINNYFYHVYNRGVEQRTIYLNSKDARRFISLLEYYSTPQKTKYSQSSKLPPGRWKKNEEQMVEIISYCLMPNHFHLLLKQLTDQGISKFLSLAQNSYTRFFNTKYKRIGPLFQGTFKSVFVETDEQLLHLSRYIHLNPLVSGLVNNLKDYQWSSYQRYIRNTNDFVAKETILSSFKSVDEYQKFIDDQAEYGRKLEIIKHQILDF